MSTPILLPSSRRAWARFGVSLTERMPCSVQFSDKMNVGIKSSLLSLTSIDAAALLARYTAALDLGRAEQSHHFENVTLFYRASCLARVARQYENALASARAIERRTTWRRIRRTNMATVIIMTTITAITTVTPVAIAMRRQRSDPLLPSPRFSI